MKQTKGQDYSTILIWSAAIVTVVRYAAAFIASDMGEISGWVSELITILMGFSGLGMGVLDVIGGTYLADGWRKAMPKNGQAWPFRFKVLTGFIVSLVVTGVFILVPFTVSRVTHEGMADVLTRSSLTWWAFFVNAAPYLLIFGVAVGNQVVTVNSSESFRQVSDALGKVSDNVPMNWRKVSKNLTPEQVTELAQMRTGDIAYKYGVDERTARNWRKYAQRDVEKVQA